MNDREGDMMEPTDAEDDLLDMAFGLEATSRYGVQLLSARARCSFVFYIAVKQYG